MQIDRRTALMGAGAAALLNGCAATSALRRDRAFLAEDFFATSAENQASTFAHMDRTGPSRIVWRSRRVLRLPPQRPALEALSYKSYEGADRTLALFMDENRTAGLIILKNGAVALERYGMGAGPHTRWQGFSVAKPITSTLAGAALAEGAIESLDDAAGRYVPALRGSSYEGVSVRNLMRLMSGVAWNEDTETSGGSDMERLMAAVRSRAPDALMNLMRSLPRAAPQGEVFNYSTGEAYVLGEVVAHATGKTLSRYLSEKVWARMAMGANATWLTCGEGGPEIAGYGVNARLRDFARFGLFVLNDGIVRGARLLPQGWRDLAGQPDNPVTHNGFLEEGYPLGHGYNWWTLPTGADAMPNHDAAFTAQGIFGQIIYVNAKENVVAIVLSAWREPWETEREMDFYALVGAAIERLRV